MRLVNFNGFQRSLFFLMAAFCLTGFGQNQNSVDSNAVTSSQNASRTRFVVGAGGADDEGLWGFGGNVELQYKVVPQLPLYVGFLSGFYHYSESNDLISASAFQIPMALTGQYLFDLPESTLHPYVGIALGAAITRASGSNILGDTASETKAHFQGLFRPGIEIPMSDSVNFQFEPALGLLDGDFNFLPHIGLAIGL